MRVIISGIEMDLGEIIAVGGVWKYEDKFIIWFKNNIEIVIRVGDFSIKDKGELRKKREKIHIFWIENIVQHRKLKF